MGRESLGESLDRQIMRYEFKMLESDCYRALKHAFPLVSWRQLRAAMLLARRTGS